MVSSWVSVSWYSVSLRCSSVVVVVCSRFWKGFSWLLDRLLLFRFNFLRWIVWGFRVRERRFLGSRA